MKMPNLSIDLQTLLLLLLTAAFLINSMALFHREHNPWVVIYNPTTNIAEMVQASRDEQSVRDLMLGGFRDAVALATGSFPFEGEQGIKEKILEQMFEEKAGEVVQHLRGKWALGGSARLAFNDELQDIKVKQVNGGFYFDAHFTQGLGVGEGQWTRTFQAKGYGHVAPATMDNPYQIKFSDLDIQEINIRKQR